MADADEPEHIDLGYPLPLAYDLWTAWDKGIMPNSGGYLDQPIRWRTLIHTLNRRYRRAYAQAKDDHDPDTERRGRGGGGREVEMDADEAIDLITGGGNPFAGGGARPSWERFGGNT